MTCFTEKKLYTSQVNTDSSFGLLEITIPKCNYFLLKHAIVVVVLRTS